jgi:hypothetical protein
VLLFSFSFQRAPRKHLSLTTPCKHRVSSITTPLITTLHQRVPLSNALLTYVVYSLLQHNRRTIGRPPIEPASDDDDDSDDLLIGIFSALIVALLIGCFLWYQRKHAKLVREQEQKLQEVRSATACDALPCCV